MTQRIGLLTGGGDCPGMNAVLRAVVLAAHARGWEAVGLLDGFNGLLTPVRSRPLAPADVDDLLAAGGTILGTAVKGRFSAKVGHGDAAVIDPAVLAEAKRNFDSLGLAALVVAGGEGSLSIGLQCQQAGIPVVGVPKTIDNDLAGTDVTFGFDTAVGVVVDAVDRVRTHATSHHRTMIVETMGRYTGWIALHAGLAAGADVILLPEIPFDYGKLAQLIAARAAAGRAHTIIVAAEGARPVGGDFVGADGGPDREARLGGVGHVIAAELERRTGRESRAVVPAYLQRGGTPSAFDRQLCTRLGAHAVRLVAERQFGRMAAVRGAAVVDVPLTEATAGVRRVPVDGEAVRAARETGVSFGD